MYPIRINKFLTQANYCSRRQADQLIKRGRVKINQQKAQLGDKINSNDKVFVDIQEIKLDQKEKVYLAFNKPVGVICTTDRKAKDNIVSYVNYPTRVYPIGRLDVNSSGLILLTNDGSIVNKILKGRNKVEKEYLVTVNKDLNSDFLLKLKKGIVLDRHKTLPAKVQKISSRKFKITIVQGKNRQIRRMCQQFNYEVTALIRVRIGKLQLGDLNVGHYRKISFSEIK